MARVQPRDDEIMSYTPLIERFWAKVEVRESGCWEWGGKRHRQGYGEIVGTNHQACLAHRISWELNVGPIPDGMVVCHHCDNPPCVRPEHLFLGTQADNVRDMITKGRNTPVRGESQPRAKLSAFDVREIRAAWNAGESQSSIAKRFGLRSVWRIISGQTWAHVPLEAPTRRWEKSAKCKNGHIHSPANTRVLDSGARVCRACQRDSQRRCMARKREIKR